MKESRIREVIAQVSEVGGRSSAKAIDRLIRVADGHQARAFTRQLQNQSILRGVEVLELVYQQIGETRSHLFPHGCICF